MASEPAVELGRIRKSNSFRTYQDLRRMSMCYGMMDAKLEELISSLASFRRSFRGRPSFTDIEEGTMGLCQTLADFLSRMYACKNLAAMVAKRCGVDREFRELKHSVLGFEAALMVNLRNYVVHVDMMPLEADATGTVRFTRRCVTDGIWGVEQRRYLRGADVEELLTVYRGILDVFYARFFGLLSHASRGDLRECRSEIGELNRRVGYEMVRFDPFAEARGRLASSRCRSPAGGTVPGTVTSSRTGVRRRTCPPPAAQRNIAMYIGRKRTPSFSDTSFVYSTYGCPYLPRNFVMYLSRDVCLRCLEDLTSTGQALPPMLTRKSISISFSLCSLS